MTYGIRVKNAKDDNVNNGQTVANKESVCVQVFIEFFL